MHFFALRTKPNVVIQVIYITCSCQVFVFPILQSPPDMALNFRTCQLHTAWELLHENGGNERQAFTKPPLLQESRLTGGGSPNLVVLVEWKVPVERFMGAANCFH